MHLTIKFNLDNDAYKHDDGSLDMAQVAGSVWDIQDAISQGYHTGSVTDINGNDVGDWEITPKPDA